MPDGWDRWYSFGGESPPPHAAASGQPRRSEPLHYLVPILLIGFAAAIGIIGWQGYSYLRFGQWPALSIVAVLQWLQIDWARSPRDWMGLHELLDAIPLSLAAFVAGIVPLSVWYRSNEHVDPTKPNDWGE